MNHVTVKIHRAETAKWRDESRAENATRLRISNFLSKNLVGIDLNPNLVKASKMNMVMNNDGAGGLYQGNSLASPANWLGELRDRSLLGGVDVLFTNPPFGSKIPIDDPGILEKYDLGHIWIYNNDKDQWVKGKGTQKSQPPEILFIERCVQFLKPGSGRAAIVLPDGILGSPGLGYVREWLLQHTRVLASVDLHPDTFQPSTSVQTSLLVFERKSENQIALESAAGKLNDYDVFMALGNHIGHDKRGNLTYVRDHEGNEIVEEFEERLKEYRDGKPTFRTQVSRRKRLDDNTEAIAREFRAWLATID